MSWLNWKEAKDYKPEWVQQAKDRTSDLIKKMARYDISLRTALASAYMQGIADCVEVQQQQHPAPEGEE